MSREVRRGLLDDLRVLNDAKFAEVADLEIVTHIERYSGEPGSVSSRTAANSELSGG